MTPGPAHPVILYDGACGFCAGWVQWVLARDHRGLFRFAALDSNPARALLAPGGDRALPPESVVLVRPDGRIFTESAAALRIPALLGWPWRAAAALLLVPRPIRDGVYRWIAARRHRLAPARCLLPTPDQRSRFLDRGVS